MDIAFHRHEIACEEKERARSELVTHSDDCSILWTVQCAGYYRSTVNEEA